MSEFKTKIIRNSIINDLLDKKVPAICIESVTKPSNYSPLHRRLASLFKVFTPNDRARVLEGQCRTFGVGHRRYVHCIYLAKSTSTGQKQFDVDILHQSLTAAIRAQRSLNLSTDLLCVQRLYGSRKDPVPLEEVLQAVDVWAEKNKVRVHMYVSSTEK